MGSRPRPLRRGGSGLPVQTARATPRHVCLRYRVDAAGVERVASGDAPHGAPPAAAPAESPDGFVAVVGAGRLVPAAAHGTEERSQGDLVDTDQRQADSRHRPRASAIAPETSGTTASRSAFAATASSAAGADTTMSTPRWWLTTGATRPRSRRRRRLRATACGADTIAKPAREIGRPLAAARTRIPPERASTPLARTAAKRLRPRRRCRRFTVALRESCVCDPSASVPWFPAGLLEPPC